MRRSTLLLLVAVALSACHESATTPDDRTGPYSLELHCASGATALTCTANMDCGLYGCAAGVPTGNVTSLVSWSVDDSTVAALTGKGVLVSVNPGKTTLRALLQSISLMGSQRVGVFSGTPPLPLFELSGVVYEGSTVNDGRVDGALVEVTAGLVQGATAVTGTPPAGSGFSAGAYTFLDVPPGAMTLRVSKEGYVTVLRDIMFPAGNPADLDFQIHQ